MRSPGGSFAGSGGRCQMPNGSDWLPRQWLIEGAPRELGYQSLSSRPVSSWLACQACSLPSNKISVWIFGPTRAPSGSKSDSTGPPEGLTAPMQSNSDPMRPKRGPAAHAMPDWQAHKLHQLLEGSHTSLPIFPKSCHALLRFFPCNYSYFGSF